MLSALLGELETCKSELLILRNGSSQQINNSDTKNKKLAYAENLSKETPKIGGVLPNEAEKSLIVENCLEEIKKARLKADNLSQELEIKKRNYPMQLRQIH
ncbi:hypothetical protein WUBG_00707 [Wuchereria bancrofti]|uniref:Uncharacterized protein n=1 Tax=Wuchereria bancrofti TaxID=6293 RepID=J9FFG4_WUCBA|nr:hypothetical protein WUBG_00707 [Wuchereria bancrofti]